MAFTLDYQIRRKTQRQQIIDLLNQLSSLSTALRAVREQKKSLFELQQILWEKRAYCEQWQALSIEESTLLQQLRVVLAQLASL